jgi:hypothetical protein
LLVEFTTLTGVAAVLVLPLDLTLALFIYIGYQITFALGGYLVRCETLLMVSIDQLRKLDMAKQVGYLLGMAVAWAAYTGLAAFAGIQDRAAQVIALHWPLLVIEAAVIAALLLAFNREELRSASAPLAL